MELKTHSKRFNQSDELNGLLTLGEGRGGREGAEVTERTASICLHDNADNNYK